MYEKHFGLKKRPFRANAIGTDVFVGPQFATTMAGIKKALNSNDSIVTVTGPVGSGKTTLVNRALESLDGNWKTVVVARMRLGSDDVLELLLDELGVQEKPKGTIQKFALFRRNLKELAANDTRVIIAIEDCVRLGVDTLAEVEALTAADAGESEGTGLVLMGDETLDPMLREVPLARVQQRVRQRLTTVGLPVAEVRGYLRHCFRLAGREFEQVFEANAAALLHHLSKGIPRIVNNLVESAMTAATDQDLDQVPTSLLARVAENEFGLSAIEFDIAPPPTTAPVVESATPAAQAAPELADEVPSIVFAEPCDDTAETPPVEAEIPELIQDTLPNLAILAPKFAESDGDDVPEWDRDPTMAELKPDLDALEQAMAFAQSDDPNLVTDDAEPLPEPEPEVPELIPEITLDHAISQRIESKLIDEPGEISAPETEDVPAAATDTDAPALNLAPRQNRQADAEIEKIAADLAKAKSIEDVDDKMAETLFGDEINFVAAQILANPPSQDPANDELDAAVATEQPVATGSTSQDFEVTLEAPKKFDDAGMDLSASQRLKTVRALNADLSPSTCDPEPQPEISPEPIPFSAPDSIEDQINISMTQTQKALNITPPVIDDDDDDEVSKSGFFGRFKRS